jgi:hypothetical protein
MRSKHTLRRLVGLALVVAACSAGPAAAITDPPRSEGGSSAANYYTPAALKAQALRWTAMAELYGVSSRPDDRGGARTIARSAPVSVLATSSGFDWSDAGVGAASGFILAACAAAALVFARRPRLAT